jgi:transaldolase
VHSIDWAFWFRVGEMISIAVAAFFVGRVYQFRKTQHLETLNEVLMARNLMQAYQQATKHIDAAKSRTTQMIEKQDEMMRELDQERDRLMGKDDAPESH